MNSSDNTMRMRKTVLMGVYIKVKSLLKSKYKSYYE